jgi:predicted DNA-binding protein
MKKDTQITFRVPAELKARLQDIAGIEGRSTAQICEAFLRAGSENYKKEGAKFLHRFIGRGQKGNVVT